MGRIALAERSNANHEKLEVELILSNEDGFKGSNPLCYRPIGTSILSITKNKMEEETM